MDSEIKEISKQIADVREWLVRLDTKIDHLQSVKQTAEEADKKADEALMIAKENAKDIEEIKADDKNKWRAIYGTIASFLTALALYYFTR